MLDKLVSYRGIIHERAEDAPFMGALIIAKRCSNNCQGCFNQRLKNSSIYIRTASEIISEIKANPFNDGIILGGLEWSEQPEEAIARIQWARLSSLRIMLYTGLTEEELFSRIPKSALQDCHVKFGRYDEARRSSNYYSFGIRLASTNQYIKYIKYTPGKIMQ